jgi:hypothetical protein
MFIISRIQFDKKNNNNHISPVTTILCLALSLGGIIKTILATRKYDLYPAVSKELYQLRPKVSASCVFAVSRVVNRTRELHRKIWVYRTSKNLKVLHSFIVRYFIHNYMHTYGIVEWYWQCTIVISCYCLMLKSYRYFFKYLFGEDGWHIMFLMWQISSCYYDLMNTLSPERDLIWSDEHTVSGKSFNAAGLGVPSTWPVNCDHIILIHSTESPVWYFVNILLFYVKKLFNWFSKYVWYLVAHICVNSCFHSWNEKRSSKYQDKQIPIVRVARTKTLYLQLLN